MQKQYPKTSLGMLCGLFGYSRQAYYKRQARAEKIEFQGAIIVDLLQEIREKVPGIGGKKLYFMLKDQLVEYGFKVGRDHFFKLLRDNDLLIKRRKRRWVTTMSNHILKKYSNLIIDLQVDVPNQLWVSDITYIRVASKWNYVIL